MNNKIEQLLTGIGSLRNMSPSGASDCRAALNKIFETDAACVNFIYTLNTDKLPFGCIVMPKLDDNTIKGLFISGDPMKFHDYDIELDSKLFDYGLDDLQIASVILYNIFHMVSSSAPSERFREILDTYLLENYTQMSIKDSTHYCSILALGLADTIVQLTNCQYIDSSVENDAFLESFGIYNFKETIDKMFAQIPGCDAETTRVHNVTMLPWCLRLYNNVKEERVPALHTLKKCKDFTASSLYLNKFDRVINALNKIDTDMYVTESYNSYITESAKKGSLFHQIRRNGLKGIEADIYEYIVMARNAETESEVMYALKQINVRLSILDDYLTYEDIDDHERERWEAVRDRYLELRDNIAQKKCYNRKNYGVFVDYNRLDQMDDGKDENYY